MLRRSMPLLLAAALVLVLVLSLASCNVLAQFPVAKLLPLSPGDSLIQAEITQGNDPLDVNSFVVACDVVLTNAPSNLMPSNTNPRYIAENIVATRSLMSPSQWECRLPGNGVIRPNQEVHTIWRVNSTSQGSEPQTLIDFWTMAGDCDHPRPNDPNPSLEQQQLSLNDLLKNDQAAVRVNSTT